jgi:hypothetical protein
MSSTSKGIIGGEVEGQLAILAAGPAFLRELLSAIPAEFVRERRKQGKWTIHEHAVHLTMVDDVMIPRLVAFREQASPQIVPYQPGPDEEEGSMLRLDLAERLDRFDRTRAALIDAFSALARTDWDKRARHPQYIEYSPRIMLRHLLMHDHLHCYRIEELWLTPEAILNG